jgi:hypothetical protein
LTSYHLTSYQFAPSQETATMRHPSALPKVRIS